MQREIGTKKAKHVAKLNSRNREITSLISFPDLFIGTNLITMDLRRKDVFSLSLEIGEKEKSRKFGLYTASRQAIICNREPNSMDTIIMD